MNLTDAEILELTELCNALADGSLTATQRARLAERLAASEAARRFYVRFTSLAASLCQYAGEMQAEAPDVARATPRLWRRPALWWSVGPLAAAAAAALVIFSATDFSTRKTATGPVELETQDYVAQVTGMKDCAWADGATALEPGDQVERGRRLDLAQGLLEITFDCGAQVTLAGPATLELNSAWKATLPQGTLSAVVPAEAIGFRVSNPQVDVVDLGTEFSVVARTGRATEVYVHKGKIQALPHANAGHEQPALVLTAEQSREFDRSGSAEIPHATPPFQALAGSAPEEHAARPPESAPAKPAVPAVAPAPATNRFANALKFDGRFEQQRPAPPLTHTTPHTVTFWVRIPAGTPLSAAGAMVAWVAGGGRSQGTPIHIAWNTDPAAGALGALRTECGHAAAVGATSLRDGRWHHVAVVFVPHGRGHGRLHVKQYVDGHLEGSVTPTLSKHPREKTRTAPSDVVWLGRRPGSPDHFHGELDELVISDQALAPQQIKKLRTGHQPDRPTNLRRRRG